MKLITTLFLGFSSLFAAVELVAPATVDKAESQIRWEASKVTGTHWGYVPLKNATLDYSAGKITGGSFDMDMVNLTVEDLTDPKSKGNLTGHLKSDDFFSVDKFNTSTFKITEAKSSNGTDYTITGTLTIKGIAQKVSFPAVVAVVGKKVTATGKITFDRTKFDIKFRSGSYFEDLADKLIYDEVKLDVKLVAAI
ncbi:MAG: YceI family protein [Algoriphagus sp.]|uniref:YceI family protein n=1 Tax=Algoriphagus sp. TaxID=1872435 RepID=UPI002773942C|nr:YceI family protein [Algoriphagus sp.]MDP4747857.1 YceI family protein [Algoriphagus sp.]MDP4839669.1 YceI family protein [Algoriphagus sp.]MDP4904636.1 YceI family protein [Algoriphagus sp.]MDP4956457.1 YceI family protein [Algoriphagus sp.]